MKHTGVSCEDQTWTDKFTQAKLQAFEKMSWRSSLHNEGNSKELVEKKYYLSKTFLVCCLLTTIGLVRISFAEVSMKEVEELEETWSEGHPVKTWMKGKKELETAPLPRARGKLGGM